MAQRSVGDMAGRVLLTLIGASGLIVGAFMEWLGGRTGMRLDVAALWRETLSTGQAPATVGVVVLLIALVAIVGLATSGWLTRLAGALAIVVFVLLMIQLYTGGVRELPGPGPWLVLAGGIVAATGGG